MKNKGSLNGTSPILYPFPVKESETIVAGDIVVFDTGQLANTADAAAAGTVAGVAAESVASAAASGADEIKIDINPATIYTIDWAGTATPVVNSAYDIDDGHTMDSDDTTGGYVKVIGNITTTTCDVVLINRAFVMG